MTIAHISDPHFGRIAHPGVVDALIQEVNEKPVDLVAISGDLTQRALPREFKAARAMLDTFEPPHLVVPGNHDVYPWWRPFRRLRTPLARYREFITDELMPSYETDAVSVLGLNSAHGATIKGGRIGPEERAHIRDHFSAPGDGRFKVLVVHHQLTEIQGLTHDVARYARKTLSAAAEVGVHLILCGHLHVSHVGWLDVVPGRQGVVIASAGTATSNRWRMPTGPINFYNRITVEADGFHVEERRYVPDEERFVQEESVRFDRPVAPETVSPLDEG